MSVKIESNSYLTEEQQQVYQLRESLERNGGNPVGFLGLLAAVLRGDTWRKIPSGVNDEKPFASFSDFITAKPPFGLGSEVEHVRVLLQLRHPHEGVAHVREEMDTMRAQVRKLLGPAADEDPIAQDAQKFGVHARSGGWVFGLMVARSVQPGQGHGGDRSSLDYQRSERTDGNSGFNKVSAKRFAAMSGTSSTRVMRFYRAWERAVSAGVVPDFDDLVPGQDIELPKTELWGEYFTRYEQSTDRRESIAEQAEAAGTSYTEAMKVAGNPAALRTAILGDPRTAEAARKALADRLEDDAALQIAMARTVAAVPELKKAVASEARRTEQLDYIRRVAGEGKLKTPAGQLIDAPPAIQAEAQRHLAAIESSQEPSPGESAAEAYEAVQDLVAEAIEKNPEVHVAEQRARVHKVLASTARRIASVSDAPLAEIVDEELIREVTALQESVNALIALLPPQTGKRLKVVDSKAL
ncbi:hypothetical protein [Streptomyces sp. NPDC007074]|uniref:hypothetical protein n=1 Tax=Streptomyces sp. NPDC007074 TaxID=3156764 RepID=UPI0033C63CFB